MLNSLKLLNITLQPNDGRFLHLVNLQSKLFDSLSLDALNYIPSTEIRRSSEIFSTSGLDAERTFRDEAERRLDFTL